MEEQNLLMEHFWNVFVMDAFLGNFDRHNGNWGFLYDQVSQKASIAPVYDCGSCLLPQADEQVMQTVLENEDELNARVFRFPTSALKQNDKKINYFDFLTSTVDTDCIAALKRVYPRINMAEINFFVDEVPYLTKLQREFYKAYLKARYELILQPAYSRIQRMQES